MQKMILLPYEIYERLLSAHQQQDVTHPSEGGPEQQGTENKLANSDPVLKKTKKRKRKKLEKRNKKTRLGKRVRSQPTIPKLMKM